MITGDMAQALNQHLNREYFSAYFYLGMSAWSEDRVLKGMASWFMAKHQEETEHAMKFYRYLLDQGATITLLPIAQPTAGFDGIIDVFAQTLEHEREVTGHINDLMDKAQADRDHATQVFLQWFITEQIEEESVVSDILSRLKMFGENGQGLFLLDNELGRMAQVIQQGATQ